MWGVIQNIGSTGKGSCLLTTNLEFDETVAESLPTIPDNANSAIITLEADSTAAAPERAAHFSEKEVPTAALGLPISDNSPYEIIGYANLVAFKIIGIEATKTHKLQIEYFS